MLHIMINIYKNITYGLIFKQKYLFTLSIARMLLENTQSNCKSKNSKNGVLHDLAIRYGLVDLEGNVNNNINDK